MASINQAVNAALAAGFVRTTCVHKGWGVNHIVLDYPSPATVGGVPRRNVWRLHIDRGRLPHVTHIVGPDTPEQRASLKNAIDWVRRTALDHPKEK